MRRVVPMFPFLLISGCYLSHGLPEPGPASPDVTLDASRDAARVAERCTAEVPGGGRELVRGFYDGVRSPLYVVRNGAVDVLDLIEPMAPRAIETFTHPDLDEPSGAALHESFLVVGTHDARSLVALSRTPSLAHHRTMSTSGGTPRQLAPSGSALFVSSDSPQLEVFSGLTSIGAAMLPQPVQGLSWQRGLLIGAGPDLVIWDHSDGHIFPLRETSRCVGCATNAWRIQEGPGRAYVAGGFFLRIFDVSDPSAPRLTHQLESTAIGGSMHRIYDAAPFADGTVAIANDHYGFRLLAPNARGGFDAVLEGHTGRFTTRVLNWDESHLVVLDSEFTTMVDLACLAGR